MKNTIYKGSTILFLSAMIYLNLGHINAQTGESEEENSPLKSYVAIFEIPAIDLSRAVTFYENILDVRIQRYEFDGLEMGLFPYEGQMVTGLIMQSEGYQPSSDGVTVYLNGGEDLQVVLDKVEKNNGKTIIPKTPHADEVGFFVNHASVRSREFHYVYSYSIGILNGKMSVSPRFIPNVDFNFHTLFLHFFV